MGPVGAQMGMSLCASSLVVAGGVQAAVGRLAC